MDASTDPYQLLEIEHNADEDEVRKKFQSLAKVVSEGVCALQGGRVLLAVTFLVPSR